MYLLKLLAALRAYRAGAPLGDVAVLKVDALAAAPQGLNDRLASMEKHAFTPDLNALRAMPAGTLGREYARFLDDNGIVPLAISPAVREHFRREPYALRYTSTHDVHHVLTGFDAGLAGELGVLAFNVGQRAAPVSRAKLRVATFAYCVVSPMQARASLHNVRVGLAMGEKADLVMAAPLESYFEQPLAEVRRKLGIPDPREAGVLPSGRSVLTRLLMQRA